MAKQSTNTAASVHARLLNQARAGSRSFNDLLQLYAMERLPAPAVSNQARRSLRAQGRPPDAGLGSLPLAAAN